MDDGGAVGACGSPANKSSNKQKSGGGGWIERRRGNERLSRDSGLIYEGFPFNKIVSVTEPVKGP